LADHDTPNEGKLSISEVQELDQHLQEVTYRRTLDIVQWVKENFEQEYSTGRIAKLLHRLDYVYKKPKKLPPKTSPEHQQDFIKADQKLKAKLNADDSILFMDNTYPQHGPIPSYGWRKRGQCRVLKSNFKSRCLSINAAINPKTLQTITLFNKSLTKETSLAFLEQLRRQLPYGVIYLICG